jgi:hypothetical protein
MFCPKREVPLPGRQVRAHSAPDIHRRLLFDALTISLARNDDAIDATEYLIWFPV